MSLKFRKRTRSLACIIPGVRSTSSTCGSKGQLLEDGDDYDDDDCSRLLIGDNPEGRSYNLSIQEEEVEGEDAEGKEPAVQEQVDPLNDTVSSSDNTTGSHSHTSRSRNSRSSNSRSSSHSRSIQKAVVSPTPGMDLSVSDTSSSAGGTWPEMTQSFPDQVDTDHSSLSMSSVPSSLKSLSLSAPNSPYPSAYSTMTPSSHYTGTSASSVPSSPANSIHSAPVTPTRSSRLPLTSPMPRRPLYNNHRRSQSANSNILLPMALPPPACEQVLNTMMLLKSIKKQIKTLKRRESHLSTKLHVQRRERQQMQDQIGQLEARRLRVEAMFVRPLPLVLLLPVAFSVDDEYDLCLVSEGNDAWNALQPLIRVQLRGRMSCATMRALLLHFGPTLTQPMAAAASFLPHDPMEVAHLDLQPLIKQRDLSFWDRTTCGQVLEADPNQLSEGSCQFLFDALTEHKHLWRDQLVQVVDKKTRRIQWILRQEADSLYYDAIPSSPSAPAPIALVEMG